MHREKQVSVWLQKGKQQACDCVSEGRTCRRGKEQLCSAKLPLVNRGWKGVYTFISLGRALRAAPVSFLALSLSSSSQTAEFKGYKGFAGVTVIRDCEAKKLIFKLKPNEMEEDEILLWEALFFFTATISDYYCLFPEIEFKQVCLILQVSWSASVLIVKSIRCLAYFAPGGMLNSIPAIWQRRRGHTSASLRGDRPHRTTSCTHEEQFGFHYCCHTRSICVCTVTTQADERLHKRQNAHSRKEIVGPVTLLKQGNSSLNELLGIHVEIIGMFVIVEIQNLQIELLFHVPAVLSKGFLCHLAYFSTSIICLDFQKNKAKKKKSFL